MLEGVSMILGQDVTRILAYDEPVDMRKSFKGLLGVIECDLKKDALDGSLYVFFNKRRNYVKGILWHRTGFVLLAKKLEQGRFCLPSTQRIQTLESQIFLLLLDGNKLGFRG